jgi:hypothetical protein
MCLGNNCHSPDVTIWTKLFYNPGNPSRVRHRQPPGYQTQFRAVGSHSTSYNRAEEIAKDLTTIMTLAVDTINASAPDPRASEEDKLNWNAWRSKYWLSELQQNVDALCEEQKLSITICPHEEDYASVISVFTTYSDRGYREKKLLQDFGLSNSGRGDWLKFDAQEDGQKGYSSEPEVFDIDDGDSHDGTQDSKLL